MLAINFNNDFYISDLSSHESEIELRAKDLIFSLTYNIYDLPFTKQKPLIVENGKEYEYIMGISVLLNEDHSMASMLFMFFETPIKFKIENNKMQCFISEKRLKMLNRSQLDVDDFDEDYWEYEGFDYETVEELFIEAYNSGVNQIHKELEKFMNKEICALFKVKEISKTEYEYEQIED